MGAEGEGRTVNSFAHYKIIDISLYSKKSSLSDYKHKSRQAHFYNLCMNVVGKFFQLASRFSGRNYSLVVPCAKWDFEHNFLVFPWTYDIVIRMVLLVCAGR